MSKVFLVDVPNEYGTRGLIGDGKMLKFQFNGTCIGEFPIDFTNISMQQVEVVSLLVYGNEVEIAVSIDALFNKKMSMIGLADVAKQIQSLQGMVFTGFRKDTLDGVLYTQYLYAFRKGSLPNNILG